MTNASKSGDRCDQSWADFARRHVGSPFLSQGTIYSLGEPVIDAIKQHAPAFFRSNQERFERDLSQTASVGFFQGRALGRATNRDGADPDEASLDERQRRSSQEISEMLSEEMRRSGLTKTGIDSYFKEREGQREKVTDRMVAFAGWLVTNPDFQHEVRVLRSRWGRSIEILKRFPTLPKGWISDGTVGVALPRELREDFERFYCRWNLESMLTWDWPVPMEPDFVGGLRDGIEGIQEAGVTLFVPWYILRGDQISLRDVARLARVSATPDHLAGWANKRDREGGDDAGDVRYGHLWRLYRCYELVLTRRYSTECKGKLGQLDRAIATVFGRDVDSVKKLRLQLKRSMEAAHHPST